MSLFTMCHRGTGKTWLFYWMGDGGAGRTMIKEGYMVGATYESSLPPPSANKKGGTSLFPQVVQDSRPQPALREARGSSMLLVWWS